MRYMNDYDIESAARRYRGNPVLMDAVQTLSDLKDWTDSNSDGWAYWPKPARAAAQLMELIDGDGTTMDHNRIMARTTQAELDKALRTIKALRTKMCGPSATATNHANWPGHPMPWFPITAAERAEVAAKRESAADAARADSIARLAAKFEPVIRANPASHAADMARELAGLAVAGW